MMGLEKGRNTFYRAYAINSEGVGYGVVKDFENCEKFLRHQVDRCTDWCGYELVDQFMVWFLLHESSQYILDYAFGTGLVVSDGPRPGRSLALEGKSRLVVDK